MPKTRERPAEKALADACFYAHELDVELIQCKDEGIDLRQYEDLILAVTELKPSQEKEKLADTIYDLICTAKKIRGYKYKEPSDRDGIFALCEGGYKDKLPGKDINDRIYGAWYGRVAGCLLGKPLEGIR